MPGEPGRSLRFGRPVREVVAWGVEEVMPALREVEAAAGEGLYAAGFVCYEAAPALEPALAVHPPVPGLPLVWFGIFAEPLEGDALEGLPAEDSVAPELAPTLDAAEYERRARRILDLIAAGDTYQVNFTFPLAGRFAGSPAALYRDLCLAQRSGYCALVEVGPFAILSASPELFFRRQGDLLELRPMKGTRPRGRWSAEDDDLADELAGSAKDRAENLMIVDLLRNDLGRIAEFGSVRVSELYGIERYPTVLQMTSSVEGTLRPRQGIPEIFTALFPSGSVTGAPKIRTSQIIHELETGPRGVYTGAIGFVGPETAVFSVAIRTLTVDRRSGTIALGVGSGVTADSRVDQEYAECIGKGAFVGRRIPEFELLESLRLESGGYPLLHLHLDRLTNSARYFAVPFDRAAAHDLLLEAAGTLPAGTFKVRLLVDRDGAMRVTHEPIPERLPAATLRLADAPIDDRDPFLYHKTTHRQVYRDALARQPGVDDVILFNERGELTETANANLVLDIDGALVTPPVAAGLLPGVYRRKLLEEGHLREGTLYPEDLAAATAIHLINAVRGWREAVLVAEPTPANR